MVNVVRSLGLSKGAAFYRKTAAELIQRYPEVVEPLRDGRLCITSVVELARVITPENRGEVVARFFHASKREAKAISAELCPAEAAPGRDVVTLLHPAAPVPAPSAQVFMPRAEPAPVSVDVVRPDELDLARPVTPQPPAEVKPRDEAEPLTGELRRLHVTVSRRFLAKLAVARDALSHSQPDADAEAVLEAGLDLLLAAHAKRKGLVGKPQKAPARPSSRPDHVPAEVRRAVWTRDQGRCQWALASGGICGSTTRVQFDHIVPLARGGPSTIENGRLLCAFHNRHAARQALGDAVMDRYAPRPAPA